MKKLSFSKKLLSYALTILMVLPAYLGISSFGASKVQAAGLDTQDFGVMQLSGVNGYSVGFGLMGMQASDLKSAEVKLYEGVKLLSTDLTTGLLTNYPTATSLSAPFNINGYFDYTDGNWSNTGWNGTVEDVPTKATVLITDNADKTYAAEYGAPTGTPSLLEGHDYTGAQALAVVQPADFGTMRFSGVSGYSVGFSTTTYKASQLKKINIDLFKGDTLLGSVVSDQITSRYPDAMSLSAPFDVNGTFPYASDAAWTYSGWKGVLTDIPTNAVIKVTDKMDNTYTVENGTLTGTPLPYMVAEDFGVMQVSGVNGYTVGFGLNGITAADVASVKVELFKGSSLLSTSNGVISSTLPPTAPSINSLGAATSLSAPFNIDGTFSYHDDGYWSNTGWNGSLSDVPTRAVVTVKDTLGANYIVENNNLTGEPSLLFPSGESQDPVIVVAAQQGDGKTISIDFKGSGTDATGYIVTVNGVQIAIFTNILGDDTLNIYHSEIGVSSYGSYAVQVLAMHYGIEVGKASASVVVNAPQNSTTTVTPVVTRVAATSTTGTASSSSSSVAQTTSPVVTPPATTTPAAADQGQIKGTETTAPVSEDAFNWTPWIILIIIIALAGAATGGYFYWTRGEEMAGMGASVVVSKKSIPQKPAAKKTSTPKKSNRW